MFVKFSCAAGQAGTVGAVVDVAGDGREGGAEFGWYLGLVGGGEGDQEPVADLGVEDGDIPAVHVQGTRAYPGGVAGPPRVTETLGHAGCQIRLIEIGQPGRGVVAGG